MILVKPEFFQVTKMVETSYSFNAIAGQVQLFQVLQFVQALDIFYQVLIQPHLLQIQHLFQSLFMLTSNFSLPQSPEYPG